MWTELSGLCLQTGGVITAVHAIDSLVGHPWTCRFSTSALVTMIRQNPRAQEAADEAVSLAEAAVRRWNALPMGTEEAQKHQALHTALLGLGRI